MPKKIREMKKQLSQAGFDFRQGKGSHQVWTHPSLPLIRIVVARKDEADTPLYLEEQIQDALKQLQALEGEE